MGTDDRTAETNTRNQGLREEEENLHDADERPPHAAAEQRGPRPVRPRTPQQDAGQSIEQLENPPQAEGPREDSNDAV